MTYVSRPASSRDKIIRLDGIKWRIMTHAPYEGPEPLCPKHNLRLYKDYSMLDMGEDSDRFLKCEKCENLYEIPRSLESEKEYVLDEVDALNWSQMDVINLDDEFVPLAKKKIPSSQDNPFSIEAKLVKTGRGKQLVIYVWEAGAEGKSQIFSEAELRRLSFDHKDRHPSEIFMRIEAQFKDGSKSILESGEPQGK